MIAAIPLMLIPFILYNLVMVGLMGSGGIGALNNQILSLDMMSGTTWTMSLGDLLIVVSLIALFFEILKSTRSSLALINHMLSIGLFVGFLVEFLLVGDAATQIFFIMMMIAFIDGIAGFTISIKTASRDVSIGL